jgi:two-component sensor histidine kinase
MSVTDSGPGQVTRYRDSLPAPASMHPDERAEPASAGVTEAASRYTGVFRGRPDQISRVRREVTRHLAGRAAADDAALVISELATNAILHSQSGGQFFTVRAYLHDTWCRLEVEDGGGPWDASPRDRARPHGLDVIQAVAGPRQLGRRRGRLRSRGLGQALVVSLG